MSSVYGVKIHGTEGRAGMTSTIARAKVKEFDFRGLTIHLKKNLAPYAIPILLRFKGDISLTSTFKLKKSKLKKKGFNIENIKDPYYVLLPGESEYIPLTRDIYEKILNQNYKF